MFYTNIRSPVKR
jgi:transposase